MEINSTDYKMLTSLQHLLSTNQDFNKAFESLSFDSSSHPYESIKRQYLGKNYKPVDINNVPSFNKFSAKTCYNQISATSIVRQQNVSDYISHLNDKNGNSEIIENKCNAFIEKNSKDTEETFFVNQEKAKNYLEFIEFVKNIPVDKLDTSFVGLTAEKILSYFTTKCL